VNSLVARIRAWFDGLAPRERWLVLAAAGVALAAPLTWVVTASIGAASSGAERLARAENDLAAVQALALRYAEVHGPLSAVERRIQSGPRGSIFTTLETLARDSLVEIDSMEPRTSPASDAYRETRVQVALRGVTLAQTVNYLHRIESAPQLLSIKSLRIRTRADKPDLLDVTFSVSSFEPAA
jgi:type II secretory pathway component PulM